MLTSGRDVTAKAAESQAQLMQTFITTNAQKKDSSTLETIKVLAPIVGPMALKMMESRGPDAQSKAYEVLADSNMQQMAMMAQFIQTMAQSQGDQSPWVPFLQQAAGGIMETIGAYMESKKQAQQQPPRMIHQGLMSPLPPPREAQPQQPQPAPVTPAGYSTEAAPEQQAQQQQNKPDARAVTQAVMANPTVPQQYKTPQWADVIFAVHDLQPVEQTVEAYFALLEKIAPTFPPGLHDVAVNPTGATRRLLEALPVARYAPDYVEAFIARVKAEFTDEPADEATPITTAAVVVEDDYQPASTGQRVIVTPAPAPTSPEADA
jgi:hypothetical protein